MLGLLYYLKLAAGVIAGGFLVSVLMSLISIPAAEHRARVGYVELAEKTTVEAKAAELERQRNASH